MTRRWLHLVFPLLVPIAAIILLLLLPQAVQSTPPIKDNIQKFDPILLEKLDQSPAGTRLPVIIHLHPKANLAPDALPAGKEARRVWVVQELQDVAAQSQAALISELDALQATGTITSYQAYWIFNGISLYAPETTLQDLAARPEVERIVYDAVVQIEHEPVLEPAGPAAVTWGLENAHAPQVWYGLGVTGEDITVGIMDSGVDWLHPALRPNYRGQLPNGSLNHVGNWFDALDDSNVTPVDPLGHGTHVAGTILGLENLGMAPAAKWIAARTFDIFGLSTFSTIHSAFQWLLAPAGNPALAPDIVNNSWSSSSDEDEFLADIAAFKAAGILLVFSAGNSGNEPGTIGAPATYTDTLAVGAMDERGKLTWFSSTGPSIFTGRTKPEIIAPGARVLSTLPNQQYGYASGTSMSAPHVSGAAALLLSANPGLTPPAVTKILTETARPFAATHPNFQSGWGVLDVYAALVPQVTTGGIDGEVRNGNQLLAGVTITVEGPAGMPILFFTDDAGQYSIDLLPGQYDLRFTAFAMETRELNNINIVAHNRLDQDVTLLAQPTGTIQGVIRETGSNLGLPAVVRALGTPLTTTAGADGEYSLSLPAGTYDMVAAHTGHRLGQATVSVPAGGSQAQNFTLPPTDRILLVDSGWWYYNSQAETYRQGLNSLEMAHDEWPVYNPYLDQPGLNDLAAYDTVIWSAPTDSPGAIGAGLVISQYLGTGGNLFISGSYIGAIDGNVTPEAWWFIALRAMYVTSLRPVGIPPVFGELDTPFSGLAFTLNGADSALPQTSVDQVAPVPGSFTTQAMNYGENRGAGLLRGKCVSAGFNVVYLGFGLEGVSTAAARTEILERSFGYFHEPPQTAGVQISPEEIQNFALPGRTMTLTLDVFNESETITDTFQLELQNAPWPSQFVTPTLEIGPCSTGRVLLTMDVPAEASEDTYFDFTLSATSANSGLSAAAAISIKTPGNILFVDDHRFFNETAAYTTALDNLGLHYDVWETGWAGTGRGNPDADFLSAYDIILWYTGYDWFEPVTTLEADALVSFLAGGGRLFLSSQDFLYYQDDHPLTRTYLGVEQFTESVTPTIAYGGPDTLLGDLGPLPIDFSPYQNNSDGLLGSAGSRPFLWHNGGGAAGLANQGISPAGASWRTVFWAIPWEKLSAQDQEPALNHVVGYLGDLGDSTFQVSRRSSLPGRSLAYTMTLRHHSEGEPGAVAVANSLPAALILDQSSLSGGATYDPDLRQISWSGQLADGEAHQITYRAEIGDATAIGALIENQVVLHYDRHDLTHTLATSSWVDAPDVQGSALLASPNPLPAGSAVNYTLVLRNDGVAGTISATAGLPAHLFPLTDTVASSAGSATFAHDRLSWEGVVPAGEQVTVTMVMTSAWSTQVKWYPTNLVINDGVTQPLVRALWLIVTPYRIYQPAVFYQPQQE